MSHSKSTSDTPSLKVGVIGAGVFAGYHAGKVATHPRSVLSGVYDRNADKARDLADRHSSAVYGDVEALAASSDALIIAVPASDHAGLAEIGLSADCHLLIEKPMATSVEACDQLIEMARKRNCVLQIGHQERIIMEAIGLSRLEERPKDVRVIRHNGPSERNLDASVVMDLMIHDLDLLQALYGPPEWINTESAKRVYSDQWDEVRAELGYADFTVYLSASRNDLPNRKWTLRYESGTVQIDFNAKTLTHDTPFHLNERFGDDPRVQDSLASAFDRFVKACLDGEPPLATGQDGRAAVRVASIIEGGS